MVKYRSLDTSWEQDELIVIHKHADIKEGILNDYHVFLQVKNNFTFLDICQFLPVDSGKLVVDIGCNTNYFWFKNKKLHRSYDKPAVLIMNGNKFKACEWYIKGENKRKNQLPAWITKSDHSLTYRAQNQDDEEFAVHTKRSKIVRDLLKRLPEFLHD